jgi:D-glycero-D-manno-heptose 1,7-bisphosphate phosphatase
MIKAIFLDRDGVVNRERGEYTFKLKDFDILPDVYEALKLGLEKGYELFVLSNQGGIAKGLYDHEQVEKLHELLAGELLNHGVKLKEIYYCPHHESAGKCLCRKPDSLLLEKAIARFGIDTDSSVFIGDSKRDVEAASKVGVRGILIDSNAGILDSVEELV